MGIKLRLPDVSRTVYLNDVDSPRGLDKSVNREVRRLQELSTNSFYMILTAYGLGTGYITNKDILDHLGIYGVELSEDKQSTEYEKKLKHLLSKTDAPTILTEVVSISFLNYLQMFASGVIAIEGEEVFVEKTADSFKA